MPKVKIVFGDHKPGLPNDLDGQEAEVIKEGEEYLLVRTSDDRVYAAKSAWLKRLEEKKEKEPVKEEKPKEEPKVPTTSTGKKRKRYFAVEVDGELKMTPKARTKEKAIEKMDLDMDDVSEIVPLTTRKGESRDKLSEMKEDN